MRPFKRREISRASKRNRRDKLNSQRTSRASKKEGTRLKRSMGKGKERGRLKRNGIVKMKKQAGFEIKKEPFKDKKRHKGKGSRGLRSRL